MDRVRRICKKKEQQGLSITELLRVLPEAETNKVLGEYCVTINTFYNFFHWCLTLIQVLSVKHYIENKDFMYLSVEWGVWCLLMGLACLRVRAERVRVLSLVKCQIVMIRCCITVSFGETLRSKFNSNVEAEVLFGGMMAAFTMNWLFQMNLMLTPWVRIPLIFINAAMFLTCCILFSAE